MKARLLLFICLLLSLFPILIACSGTPAFELGKSAYEIAVENGFIGSEEEWLESLKNIKTPYIVDVTLQNGSVIVTYNDGTRQNLETLLLEVTGSLSFLPLPDGTYAVTAANTHIAGAITVPATYKEKPVTRVLHGAFADCTYLFSLTLPQSITAIGKDALVGCDNLLSLTVPFLGATVSDTTNTHLGYFFGADDHTENATCVPASLESVTVTGGTTLAPYAFSGCEHIKELFLADSYTSLGFSALADCKSLSTLTLPFIGNTIDGSEDNHIGYLFGATWYAEHVTAVPETLASITLTRATSLARHALFGCNGLERVYLPDTLTKIGQNALGLCPIKEVHFAKADGWQADGEPITLGAPAENARLLSDTLRKKDWLRVDP